MNQTRNMIYSEIILKHFWKNYIN